jgi:hypothetical protein
MANRNDPLAKQIEDIREELQRLRDEVRVRLHLGAMDARDAFAAIEHEVDHAEREVSQATRSTLENARKQRQALSAAFGAQSKSA